MSAYESKTSSNSMKLISSLIIAILVISTLPRGGNLAWFSFLLSCVMTFSVVIYTFNQQRLSPPYQKAWLVVWLTFTALILLQLLVIPRLVSWNSPDQTIINLNSNPVNTPAILDSWVRFTCYWLIAFFVSQFNRRAIQFSLMAIFAVLLFQVTYGVIANSLGQTTIIGIWPKEHYVTSATGSFVNHNHYANYIAMATPLIIGYILNNNISIIKKGLNYLKYLTCLVLVFASIGALVDSLSRGGTASGLAGILILLCIYLIKYRSISGRTLFAVSVIASFLLLGFISFLEVDDIFDRFKRVLIYDMRWEIWQATFDLPKSLWILGSGGGTFSDVFWIVHPPTTPKTAYFAHNDYIQFLIEYGFIGAISMCIALFYWYQKTQVREYTFLHIASLVSMLVMGIHSIVDFSLHIPANAILFWFCVGLFFNNNLNRKRRKIISNFTTLNNES